MQNMSLFHLHLSVLAQQRIRVLAAGSTSRHRRYVLDQQNSMLRIFRMCASGSFCMDVGAREGSKHVHELNQCLIIVLPIVSVSIAEWCSISWPQSQDDVDAGSTLPNMGHQNCKVGRTFGRLRVRRGLKIATGDIRDYHIWYTEIASSGQAFGEVARVLALWYNSVTVVGCEILQGGGQAELAVMR